MEQKLPFEGYHFFEQNQNVEAIFDGENWNITLKMRQSRSPDLNVKTESEEIELQVSNSSYGQALSEILLTLGYWMEMSEGDLFRLKELMRPDEDTIIQ